MNSNKRFLLIFLFISIIVLPIYLLAQSESIVINNKEVFKKKSRAPVEFPHASHMALDGISCTDCHHRFEKGKNVLVPDELTEDNKSISCAVCHKGKSNLTKAYHNQCIGCHDGKSKKKPTGPRMCGECHKRNK